MHDVKADNPTNISSPNEVFVRAVRYVVPRAWRNWLRSPSRSLEWIWDNVKFSAGITRKFSITPDVTVTLHPRAFKVAYKNQVADPEQNAEFKAFIAQCNSKMFLFDVGAHYGLFSLTAAGLQGESGCRRSLRRGRSNDRKAGGFESRATNDSRGACGGKRP